MKPKKCKECSSIFAPSRAMQVVCGPICAQSWGRKLIERQEANSKREERKSIRAAREKAKTRGTHLKELQAAVNAYVRQRDAADPCISCDRPATWDGQWHASHFLSVGSHPALRFNLLNINKACSICNNWKSGNYAGYKPRLINKIGREQVDWLEGPHEPLKLTIVEIKELKAHYRAEVRRLKKETTENLEIA